MIERMMVKKTLPTCVAGKCCRESHFHLNGLGRLPRGPPDTGKTPTMAMAKTCQNPALVFATGRS